MSRLNHIVNLNIMPLNQRFMTTLKLLDDKIKRADEGDHECIIELMNYYGSFHDLKYENFSKYLNKGINFHIPECLHRFGLELISVNRIEDSFELFEKAANLGYSQSYFYLGHICLFIFGDREKWFYYLNRGKKSGDNYAVSELNLFNNVLVEKN